LGIHVQRSSYDDRFWLWCHKLSQDPFNPNNNSNQASSEALNNDPRLPPGFPKSLPPLDKDEIKQTDALIAKADGII
jgi:hypothetical protein